mgnify:CR=1 FL=1
MWIRSQMGNSIINTNSTQNLYITNTKGPWTVLAHNVNGTDSKLGVYGSKDEAMEQLDRIFRAIMERWTVLEMPPARSEG